MKTHTHTHLYRTSDVDCSHLAPPPASVKVFPSFCASINSYFWLQHIRTHKQPSSVAGQPSLSCCWVVPIFGYLDELLPCTPTSAQVHSLMWPVPGWPQPWRSGGNSCCQPALWELCNEHAQSILAPIVIMLMRGYSQEKSMNICSPGMRVDWEVESSPDKVHTLSTLHCVELWGWMMLWGRN